MRALGRKKHTFFFGNARPKSNARAYLKQRKKLLKMLISLCLFQNCKQYWPFRWTSYLQGSYDTNVPFRCFVGNQGNKCRPSWGHIAFVQRLLVKYLVLIYLNNLRDML